MVVDEEYPLPGDAGMFRRLVAEALGTALLLAVVVGSGMMGENLAGGNVAIALLANSIATGCGLIVLILIFAGNSDAHFNPVVTLTDLIRKTIAPREAAFYILAQIFGAVLGVAVAHAMFGEAYFTTSLRERSGLTQRFSEFVATFGLIATIRGVGRKSSDTVPYPVGLYIASAYWFTASTSFANPAVSLARSLPNLHWYSPSRCRGVCRGSSSGRSLRRIPLSMV